MRYVLRASLAVAVLVFGLSCLDGDASTVEANTITASPLPSPTGSDGTGNANTPTPTSSVDPSASPTPTPAPSPTPTRACEASALRICDDFESPGTAGQPNQTYWTLHLTDSHCTAQVTRERVFDGNYALHVHTDNPTGGAGATLHNTSLFPAPNDTFYGRVFMYFDGTLPTTHSSLMKVGGKSGGNEFDWSFGTSVGLLLIDYNAPTVETYSRAQQAKLPNRAWTCIEWEYKGNTQEAHLWINGQEQTDVAVTAQNQHPAWTAPTWDHVYFGWESYNQDTGNNITAIDVYFDDVAFDDQRIGCSAANTASVQP